MTYPKLKPEIKSKWITDLRSGNFLQGRNIMKLSNEDGNTSYCCLGVLAEGQGCKSTKGSRLYNYDVWSVHFDKIGELCAFPPYGWLKTIFQNNVLSEKEYTHITTKLSLMNDHEDKNFNEIADWIEENL